MNSHEVIIDETSFCSITLDRIYFLFRQPIRFPIINYGNSRDIRQWSWSILFWRADETRRKSLNVYIRLLILIRVYFIRQDISLKLLTVETKWKGHKWGEKMGINFAQAWSVSGHQRVSLGVTVRRGRVGDAIVSPPRVAPGKTTWFQG